MTFLQVQALLFTVSAVLPLAALAVHERRLRHIAGALGEPHRSRLRLVPVALAVVAVSALLALAAAEPVARTSTTRTERRGVEVEVVFDVSGSMLASASLGAPSRLARAEADALRLRRLLPDVRFGISSMTDRTLPIIFPTGNSSVFALALRQSVGIERPPPSVASLRASSLASLANLAQGNFFTAPRRVAVVFTDGESDPVAPSGAAALRRAGVRLLLVHVWRSGEHVYLGGLPDPNYHADPGSEANLRRTASILGGHLFDEADQSGLAGATRSAVGTGAAAPTVTARDVRQEPLARWFVLAAALPLGFLLLRLNVPLELLPPRRRPRKDLPDVVQTAE